MSAGSFLGVCYQEASGCRGPPSRPCRKPTQSIRPKDIDQSNVHRSHFLSVLLAAQGKKAAGMALGLVQGELKGFKVNRPCPFLHPASGLLLLRGLCQEVRAGAQRRFPYRPLLRFPERWGPWTPTFAPSWAFPGESPGSPFCP